MILRQLMGLNTWVRVLIAFISVWVILVLVFYSKLNTGGASESEDAIRRLNQALTYLEKSKQVDQELRGLIDEYLSDQSYNRKQKFIDELGNKLQIQGGGAGRFKGVPSLEYEQLRRRVFSNTQELWNILHSETAKLAKTAQRNTPEIYGPAENFLALAAEHKRSLLNDINLMRASDGYEFWRYKESKDLSDLVQKRLTHLQNPEDCSSAKKLICRLNKGCGYGCQLHHVVYCFIMAYATERTLILKSKGWRYHKAGWEEVFQPISDTCLSADGATHASWPGTPETQVLTVPIIDSLNPRPPYLPLAIPADLAPRLMKLHGDPIVWWIGQFLKYLLKPTGETRQMLENGIEKLGFKKPIVGYGVEMLLDGMYRFLMGCFYVLVF